MERAFDAYIRARILELVFGKPAGTWSRNPTQGLKMASAEYPHLRRAWVGNAKITVTSLRHGILKGSCGVLSDEDIEDVFAEILATFASDKGLSGFLRPPLKDHIAKDGRHLPVVQNFLKRHGVHRAMDKARKVSRALWVAENGRHDLGNSERVALSDRDALLRAIAFSPRTRENLIKWSSKSQNFNRHNLVQELLRNPWQSNKTLAERIGVSGTAIGGLKKRAAAHLETCLANDSAYRAEVELAAEKIALQSNQSWLAREGLCRGESYR